MQNSVLVQHKPWFKLEAFAEVSLVVRKESPKKQSRSKLKMYKK